MKERFEGENRVQFIEALKRQELVAGHADMAEALESAGTIEEFRKGHQFITQGADDNDIYFLVAGSVAIVANGNEVATRKASETVGEMAAVEPSQPRSASVIALETVVALKVSSADFMKIGSAHPQIWLPIARSLSRRLFERNKLITRPNEAPKLFIMSSKEALDVAHELKNGLERDVFSRMWTDGVFFAGSFSLEALEKAVDGSDFAVAIAQPDDVVVSRGSKQPTLRDNVLFELGLFMGKLSRYRSILVHPRTKLKLPSDLQGLTTVQYEPGSLADLPARLAPVCVEIRTLVQKLGVRKLTS